MIETGRRKGSAMNIEIAQRLYELRRKHGFSQESLAAELGLSRQAISKWERSESAPDMGNLIALADLYGMTIDELIRPTDIEFGDDEDATGADADGSDTIAADAIDEEIEVDETLTAPAASTLKPTLEEATTCCPPPTSAPFDVDDAHPSASAKPTASDASAAAAIPGAPASYDPVPAPEPPASCNPVPAPEPPNPAAAPTQAAPYAPPAADDIKQVAAHGHIYSRPQTPPRPRCRLRSFPFPLLVTAVVVVLGLVFSFWASIWLFLTIPFYYWIARIIERDPNFLKKHGFAEDASDADGYIFNSSNHPSGFGETATADATRSIESTPNAVDVREAE